MTPCNGFHPLKIAVEGNLELRIVDYQGDDHLHDPEESPMWEHTVAGLARPVPTSRVVRLALLRIQ